MLIRVRRTVWVALIGMAACAGTGHTPDPKINWSEYTSIVVPPVTTSITGKDRAQAEYFAGILRAALIREIDSGGKLRPLPYSSAHESACARLDVEIHSLHREGKGVSYSFSWRVIDGNAGTFLRASSEQQGASGVNGGDRFAGGNSLPKVAEFIAQVVAGELGLTPASQPVE